MTIIKCSEVRVRDRNRRQILHWRRPIFGSLVVQNEDRRVVIMQQRIFGLDTKTYLCSRNETVETQKPWWEILI